MATSFGFKDYTSTHQNLVSKFKAGWIPKEDPLWLAFVGL
ncbi:putative homing endonuclease F-LimI [Dickeya phage JA15]|nr:putative homing endonuclease F-LimI [Dickeya phage JA15]ASD51451.1 putative homing endonuclease F-LimI [Dickeya phage XF4]